MNKFLHPITIPPEIRFTDLRLGRDPQTGAVRFDRRLIELVCAASGLDAACLREPTENAAADLTAGDLRGGDVRADCMRAEEVRVVLNTTDLIADLTAGDLRGGDVRADCMRAEEVRVVLNTTDLIVVWYAQHRAAGGDADPIAEQLIQERRN